MLECACQALPSLMLHNHLTITAIQKIIYFAFCRITKFYVEDMPPDTKMVSEKYIKNLSKFSKENKLDSLWVD